MLHLMMIPSTALHVADEVSIFEQLVRAGEEETLQTLQEPLHGFLARCLVDEWKDVAMMSEPLAKQLFDTSLHLGREGVMALKCTGDRALLLAGLYPERAFRLHVEPSYFRWIAQSAYARLGCLGLCDGNSFITVAKNLRPLVKVLGGMRRRLDDWHAFRNFEAHLFS